MNYASFVWSTAIIFITTPTDNKVPRVAVCHLAGILWQMTSCLVYSQLSALVSCPQRITAASHKSTNMLDVKLSFFCRRCQIMRRGWRWLVLRPNFSFSNLQLHSVFSFLPLWLRLWEQTGQVVHNVDKWPLTFVFIASGEKQNDQWERGE